MSAPCGCTGERHRPDCPDFPDWRSGGLVNRPAAPPPKGWQLTIHPQPLADEASVYLAVGDSVRVDPNTWYVNVIGTPPTLDAKFDWVTRGNPANPQVGRDVHRFWCPRWLQPAVFWLLRKLARCETPKS